MSDLRQNFSLKDIRNAVFGILIVFGGLGLAGVTLYAHQSGNPRLAGAAAIASLVFVALILLFVVPPLARNASREVSQIDLPIEITSGGLMFLGVVAIVAFAAWNTGNNLLFLVLAFLLATLIVSFVVAGANLKKLEARVRFPEAIFAASPTVFSVALRNRKFAFPTFSIALALRGSMTDDAFGGRTFGLIRPPKAFARLLRLPWLRRSVGYFIYVPRRQESEQQTEQLFVQRGRFIIKDFELSTKFPFGFWQRRKRLQVRETEIFVFPELANVREVLANGARTNGQFSSNRRGSGQDLLGLREYQPSDDVRRVDWKATARIGNLVVREFAADDERRVSIVFDAHLPEEKLTAESAARFERGVSIAAALFAHFINEKSAVQLIVSNDAGNFGINKAHLYENLRKLATIEPIFGEITETETAAANNDISVVVTANQDAAPRSNSEQIILF